MNHSFSYSSAGLSICSASVACSHTVINWLATPTTVQLLQSIAAIVATLSGVVSIVSFLYHTFKKKGSKP